MYSTPPRNHSLSRVGSASVDSESCGILVGGSSSGSGKTIVTRYNYSSSLSAKSTPDMFTRKTRCHASPSMILASNSIGSQWTVEMTTLKQSGSYFEAVQCLRRIRTLLDEVDRADRMKFCKADYDNATKVLRKHKQIWSDELFKEVVSITIDYFNMNHFKKLPVALFHEILQFIPVRQLSPVTQVCGEWCEITCANEIWSYFYFEKFVRNNLGTMPSQVGFMMNCFQRRLVDPHIGDKVEVAWRGKFRLETQDVYQGLAWWVAEVVDKHPSQERYKIRYPGWESRWDEWVPRNRLRWAVKRDISSVINSGDLVELWCCGANVPGAWLESKVKRMRGDRYCLGRVLSSGYLWVERDRIRLVQRPSTAPDGEDEPRQSLSRRRSLSNSISSISERLQSVVSLRRENRTGSCAIM